MQRGKSNPICLQLGNLKLKKGTYYLGDSGENSRLVSSFFSEVGGGVGTGQQTSFDSFEHFAEIFQNQTLASFSSFLDDYGIVTNYFGVSVVYNSASNMYVAGIQFCPVKIE